MVLLLALLVDDWAVVFFLFWQAIRRRLVCKYSQY